MADVNEVDFSDYLHKSKISRLPNKILKYYAQYEVDIAKKAANFPILELYTKRNGILFGNEIKISVAVTEIVENEYIFDGTWKTIKQLNAGKKPRKLIESKSLTVSYMNRNKTNKLSRRDCI